MTSHENEKVVESARVVDKPRSALAETWQAVRGFMRSRPWLSAGIVMVVASGALPLLGLLSIHVARTCLIVGICGLLMIQTGLWLWNRSKLPQAATTSNPTPAAAHGKAGGSVNPFWTSVIGWIIAGCVIVGLKSKEPEPLAKRADEVQVSLKRRADRKAATVAYWHATVEALHSPRFSPESNSVSAVEFLRSRLRDWEEGVARAQSASQTDADPELIEAVNRHLEIDRRGIEVGREFLSHFDRLTRQGAEIPSVPALDSRVRLENSTAEELAGLPADLRALLQEDDEITASLAVVLHDVEILQAKLNERYKPATFELPSLESND